MLVGENTHRSANLQMRVSGFFFFFFLSVCVSVCLSSLLVLHVAVPDEDILCRNVEFFCARALSSFVVVVVVVNCFYV